MTLKTLSLRLEEELFDAIEARAQEEGKTKTDLVKELILLAMGSGKPQEYGAIVSKLESMEEKLEGLLEKTLVSSAASRFYGQQQTAFMLDVGLHLQGDKPLKKKEKLAKITERDGKALEYAKRVLESGSEI